MKAHRETSDPLVSRILGRNRSLFECDIAANADRLSDAIRGSRLLVVGASGSIGSAFVDQVLDFEPAVLHAVDANENSLVELVRDIRSTSAGVEDFRTFCVDCRSIEFRRLWQTSAPYDTLINFAALKHVRSERDVFSLMRMIGTNVAFIAELMEDVERMRLKRVFSVSTDKTVRPTSLMGATKNLMEKVLFAHSDRVAVSSARFVNVAFSDGSLLQSFVNRLENGHPLAGPSDVKRYFISHNEAGQLCLLACFLGDNRDIYFPLLNDETHLRGFPEIATQFLEHHGLEPVFCESAGQAREMVGRAAGSWPCYFAASDTTGEKPVEEFYSPGDDIDTEAYENIGIVRAGPVGRGAIEHCLAEIERIRRSETWSKADIVEALRIAVPELAHRERRSSLDDKM